MRKMKIGGRTNIYGILFQVLGTVEWAFRLSSRLSGEDDEEEIRITAEPRGGDVDIQWPFARVVQQMKTRRTGKPWRLREVLDGVIPDLYLSVERERAGETRYELLLDAPQSDWPDFDSFAKYLATNPNPLAALPSAALDDSVKVAFFPRESLTQCELFVQIRDTVRRREELKDEPIEETERNLWHLLANFYVRVTPSGTAQLDALRPLLARYGFSGTEADEKIDALAGAILLRSTGEVIPFSPAELLADAGITGLPVTEMAKVRNAARQILGRDLRRRTTYSAAADVRRGMRATPESRIVAFVGESGSGKSWDLARRAERASADGIVVFRIASNDPERDIRGAIESVARDVLGWRVDRTSDDLVVALRTQFGTIPDPWLTVYLDNVGIAEVNTLMTLPLADWGVRVVLTASRAYAKALIERVPCVDVENFTASEVRAFLDIHECDPESVPKDIRETLKLPLLAWIYTTVARADREFRPENEYPIYERYWMRLRTAGEQAKHPSDETGVIALARNFRENGAYPWTTPTLAAADVDDEARQRLESIGWLTRGEHGDASIWHDRLLNWAVAESVARDLWDNRLSISDAVELMGRAAQVPWGGSERPMLRYVPMDVVWIVAHRKWITDQTLSELIEKLEAGDVIGDEIYELLTSIGLTVGPAIVLRAKRVRLRSDWLSGSFADALSNIYDRSPDFGEIVNGFLCDASLSQQTIGFMLAIRRPAERYLARIWQLRLEIDARFGAMRFPQSNDEPQIEVDWRTHLRSVELALDALRHCVREAPAWLEQNATSLAEQDAGATARLIAAVGDPVARGIWLGAKEKLKQSGAPDHVRQVLDCIRLFRDVDERPFIEEALRSSQHLTPASALAALVHVDADAAAEQVSSLDADELAMTRKWWVPWLAMLRPEELSRHLTERIRNVPADARSVAEIFDSFETLLPVAAGEALLDWLEAHFEQPSNSDKSQWLRLAAAPMEVLVSSPDSVLRAAVRARAGSRLESLLTTICSDVGDDYWRQDTEAATNLLKRIEGVGFCDFVWHTLTATTSPSRVELVGLCPDIKFVETLKERIARTHKDDQTLAVALQSMTLLAIVGGRGTVAEMARTYGERIIVLRVLSLIESDAPLDDAQIEPVLGELNSDDEIVRVKALTVLGLSGRRDQLDTVIAVARASALVSPVRNMALLALRHLIQPGDSIPSDLVKAEDWPAAGWSLVKAFLRAGTEESLDLLEQFLEWGPQNELRIDDERAKLLGPGERGQRIARRIWSTHRDWPADWWHRDWLRIAEFIDDNNLQEWFREHAFRPGPNAAIIAWELRHFDADAAWRAAVAAFERGHVNAPEVMMRLNERDAISHLIDGMPRLRSSALRAKIGRQLRLASDHKRVTAAIAALTEAGNADRRAAGYELAGWVDWSVPDSVLQQGAVHGGTDAVVQEAADAFVRRCKFAAGRQTLTSLMNAQGLRAWNDCEVLLRTVDARLLDEDRDDLCIWTALRGKPLHLRYWVADALPNAKKEIEKDADRQDRDREWS